MFGDIGKALELAFWLNIVAVPLAVWKLVDVVVWVCSHVAVRWQ